MPKARKVAPEGPPPRRRLAPAAVRSASDHTAAGEVIYGDGKIVCRNIGKRGREFRERDLPSQVEVLRWLDAMGVSVAGPLTNSVMDAFAIARRFANRAQSS